MNLYEFTLNKTPIWTDSPASGRGPFDCQILAEDELSAYFKLGQVYHREEMYDVHIMSCRLVKRGK